VLGWTRDRPGLLLIGCGWTTKRSSRQEDSLRLPPNGPYRSPDSVMAHKMSLMLAIPSSRLPSTTGRCR